MPNWSYNTVKMRGIANAPLYDNDNNFDFGQIIAEPKSKEECIELYGEDYIDNGDKNLDHRDGVDWFDWYHWHSDFWGTKWNACDTIIIDDDEINFATAWCEPKPIWIALSKMYPTELLIIYSDYEVGCARESAYVNGVCVYEREDRFEV